MDAEDLTRQRLSEDALMRAQGLINLVLPLLLLGWLSGLQACSGLPRVVVLHDPLTAEEHMALGTTYEAQGARDLAAREYRAAMTDRADYAPALVALGNLAFDSGALDEAEEYYRRALASHPDHPGANNNLAMVYLKRGDRLDDGPPTARARSRLAREDHVRARHLGATPAAGRASRLQGRGPPR